MPVIQLPHNIVFRISQQVNALHGPASGFPGPPMPQLQVDRNLTVLLGSYLANLSLQLQRVAPLTQRTGDLMQRESLITAPDQRLELQDLANQIGTILEDVSRATGSVAHFYKTLDLGQAPGSGRTLPSSYLPQFEPLINECGVLVHRPAAAAHPAPVHEEAKQPDPISVLTELSSVMTNQDMIKAMMGQAPALSHIPKKAKETLLKILSHPSIGNSVEKMADLLSEEIAAKLSDDKDQANIHEGFEPKMVVQDIVKAYTIRAARVVQEQPDGLEDYLQFLAPLKRLAMEAVAEFMDEVRDGFVNGDEDVWKWCLNNIQAYNVAQAPPQMAMMANMKSQQQLAMLKAFYQSIQAERAQAQPQPV